VITILSSMDSESPKSYDSDAILVESGIEAVVSTSSITSITGEDSSDTISISSADRQNQKLPDQKFSITQTSNLFDRGSGEVLDHTASQEEEKPQDLHFRSVCRLLDAEIFQDTGVGAGSGNHGSSQGDISCSEGVTSPSESSLEEYGGEESLMDEVLSVLGVGGPAARKRAIHPSKTESSTMPDHYSHSSSLSSKLECVSIPPLLVPKSKYIGWKHSLATTDERTTLSRILEAQMGIQEQPDTFHDILVEDFVIYRPGYATRYPWQVVTLDNIISNRESCRYLLNGVLKCGAIAEYVEAMEIEIDTISIDGFEDTEIHSVQDMVYLQTVVCARRRSALDCWYRLGEPSGQYRDLHKRFLWVADLAKHVIDYANWKHHSEDDKVMVRLQDFQQDFMARIMDWHAGSLQFEDWLHVYNKPDFRIPLNRHREFIYSRAAGLGGHYPNHDLWSDLMVRPSVSLHDYNGLPEDTLVTPYVKHCCRSMPWSYVLEAERMSESVMRQQQRRATAMGFSLPTLDHSSGLDETTPRTAALLEVAAKSGLTSAISAEEASGRFAIVRWKRSQGRTTYQEYTYVYIQKVVKSELKVIFVYLPSETICLDGQYPNPNELFLSECCNCSTDCAPIFLSDIIRLVGVSIGDEMVGLQDFFVRQKYVHNEDAISRLKKSDFLCPCLRPPDVASTDEKYDKVQRGPLSGLGLFAGCGNFDFGLEAFGAVNFVAAVEISETALKTYAANRSMGFDGLIFDSVNPTLRKILQGSLDLLDIELISAGSPCKGWSRANPYRGDESGMRNCSLVASTISYIETFLPSYAVLENVGGMGSGVGNTCNQVIACLVGLGYQVRKMKLNSRDFGSSQGRDRLFILAAAPHVPLPEAPRPSHSKTTGFAKASEVSRGLPPMDNDDLICISHADHIAGAKQTPLFRELIRRIPRYPRTMNFLQSVKKGYQGKAQLEWLLSRRGLHDVEDHMAFTRLDPDGLIPTITTSPRPACGWGGGRIIHWDEHRTLTLLEARRAQGIPDEEVIIGDLPKQWAQVGNAVNRQVATALGKVIADSWFSKRAPPGPEIVVAIPANKRSGRSQDAKKETRLSYIGDDHVRGGLNLNDMEQGEVQFVQDIFRHYGRTSDTKQASINNGLDLNFRQIQRREISTIERNAAGDKTSVRMFAERSIEVCTKAPTPSSEEIEYGSAEHPIDLETEVLISKRRRDDISDDEEGDEDELKNWVGKRVRSRMNN
jgi:DNA-cytosine methyltransferase